jgi:hypothetical protein
VTANIAPTLIPAIAPGPSLGPEEGGGVVGWELVDEALDDATGVALTLGDLLEETTSAPLHSGPRESPNWVDTWNWPVTSSMSCRL